jgi:peptidoglycan/xylan/chitin deacetylase (PgdA/CDA1 family)
MARKPTHVRVAVRGREIPSSVASTQRPVGEPGRQGRSRPTFEAVDPPQPRRSRRSRGRTTWLLILGLLFLGSLLLLGSTLGDGAATSATADASRSTTVVSLTFDDGRQTQYAARQPLDAHGMHGTFYVNSGLVGSTIADWHMTWSQLHDLARDGNEIAGHTLTHAQLTRLRGLDLRREICQDRNNLLAQGFAPVTSFAFPSTARNPTVESMVQQCGYLSARWGGGLRASNCGDCPFAETIPPENQWGIRTPTDVNTGTTLAMMKHDVTQAEEHGGGWVVLVFHSVCNACDKRSIRPDQLTAFLDWLRPRTSLGTVVKTQGEVMGDGPAS